MRWEGNARFSSRLQEISCTPVLSCYPYVLIRAPLCSNGEGPGEGATFDRIGVLPHIVTETTSSYAVSPRAAEEQSEAAFGFLKGYVIHHVSRPAHQMACRGVADDHQDNFSRFKRRPVGHILVAFIHVIEGMLA